MSGKSKEELIISQVEKLSALGLTKNPNKKEALGGSQQKISEM